MARSVHTDPLDIRAARRLASSSASRGIGDYRRRRRLARRAKQGGGRVDDLRHAPARPASRIRIIRHAPGDGYLHPAGQADVRRLLEQLSPRYRYKLHTIELRPAPPRGPHGTLPLGRLLLPGRLILYAQPCSPWLLGGLLADDEQARLQRAGACVSMDRRSCLTVVTWPAHSLRDFMLRDVLLHELAHHVLQVRRARPAVPMARRGDHEAVAYGLGRRQGLQLGCQAREHA
jgi:hypothetical protein